MIVLEVITGVFKIGSIIEKPMVQLIMTIRNKAPTILPVFLLEFIFLSLKNLLFSNPSFDLDKLFKGVQILLITNSYPQLFAIM